MTEHRSQMARTHLSATGVVRIRPQRNHSRKSAPNDRRASDGRAPVRRAPDRRAPDRRTTVVTSRRGIRRAGRGGWVGCGRTSRRLCPVPRADGSLRGGARRHADLGALPAPDVRAASIAAVLRAAEDVHVGAGVDDAATPSSGGPTSVGSGEAPIPIRVRRRPQALVGAAAAVLVLGLGVGVPLALSSRSTPGGSAESATARAPNGPPGGPEQHGQVASRTGGLSKVANAAVSDLGALDSVNALRTRAAALLPLASPAPINAPVATAAPGAASPPGSSSTSGSASAPGSAPAPASSLGGEFSPAATSATISLFERCLSSATHTVGTGRSVQFLGTAEFKGTSALVYVFLPVSSGSTTGNAARSEVVATARDGCRVLATTSL